MNRLARPDLAEPLLRRAFSGDNFSRPSWEFVRGHAKVLLDQQDHAISHFNAVLERIERSIPARVQLARTYWEAGRQENTTEMVAKIRVFAPKFSLAHAGRVFPYPVERESARLLDALTGAGL